MYVGMYVRMSGNRDLLCVYLCGVALSRESPQPESLEMSENASSFVRYLVGYVIVAGAFTFRSWSGLLLE